MASLFQACQQVVKNNIGGVYDIGGYDTTIELYRQKNIDNEDLLGDIDENKIVLVANTDTITIPSGYTLTPNSPKKSLVIFCKNFINNGTVSMYQKAPNVLPHDYFILNGSYIDGEDIIIPAYAKNSKLNESLNPQDTNYSTSEFDGNNGINRNCGSGGLGSCEIATGGYGETVKHPGYGSKSGSGYAFGGGAGTGGIVTDGGNYFNKSVDSIYPMRGGDAYKTTDYYVASGGVGNPTGANTAIGGYGNLIPNGFGCGGRVIIFCLNFTNNGIINVNGTSANCSGGINGAGGASGAGAIDIFYTTKFEEGSLTANGGSGGVIASNGRRKYYTGAGGNGSITLTQWNLKDIMKELKKERKMFTKDNWVYLFSNYSQRLREDVI